jgi:hypothetical protein
MPPRGTAAAPDGEDPFAALPHEVALAIFSRLTVEQRLRCIEVCRGWRATLRDHAAWLQLDLSRADGAACSEALLRAATSRAGGQMQALRLACGPAVWGMPTRMHGALCAVVAANAGALRELCVHKPSGAFGLRLAELEALLAAAPQLRVLHACAECTSAEETHRLLRGEPPFAPLRLREVSAHDLPADAVLSLAADVADCASLTGLQLVGVPLGAAGALDAVVDAALARRLSSVALYNCRLTPAAAPAIARLAAGGSLTALNLGGNYLMLDEATAVLLGDALRANTSLQAFSMDHGELWRDAAAGAALVGLLTGHPSLRVLSLSGNYPRVDGAGVAGAALAALLLANAPALQTLDISFCQMGDEAMRPVVEALRHNTHLTKLDCSRSGVSDNCARDELLPAVRANTSLRKLVAAATNANEGAAREAELLVAARAQTHPV